MENLTPITRKETFLAKAAGQDVETPTPVTREEVFLDAIAKGGGGGGGERTVIPVTFEWNTEAEFYDPSYVPADVHNHPEKYDLLCTFSGGKYAFEIAMFRYTTNYVNIPVYFGIMYLAEPSYFGVSVPVPDPGAENAEVNFVGRFSVVPEKFIVTLTPTSLDYSGTMDKTVAEINAAYEAGMEIVFKMRYDKVGSYIETPVYVQHSSGGQNEGFFVNVCYNNTIIVATTGANASPDSTTYYTTIYPLTPAS